MLGFLKKVLDKYRENFEEGGKLERLYPIYEATDTILFSTNFADLISIRVAIGSGTAFIVAQLLDVQIFDKLRNKRWFIAPLGSSVIGSTIDTFLFFSIAFYATGIPWISLSFGDLAVKLTVALLMLLPFRLLLGTLKPVWFI